MYSLRLVAFIVSTSLLLACAHKSGVEDHRQSASNSRASANDSDHTSKIGVPECDDFVAKYEACIDAHVPADQQRQFKENIDGYRSAWRQQIAANPDIKAALPAACKRHLEQARIAMKQFGCEF